MTDDNTHDLGKQLVDELRDALLRALDNGLPIHHISAVLLEMCGTIAFSTSAPQSVFEYQRDMLDHIEKRGPLPEKVKP